MQAITTIEGQFGQSADKQFALVVTRWNSFVVDHLLQGALDYLQRHGVPPQNLTVVRCPGAFEVPLTVKKLAASGRYDAIIALGAVIRGGTPHFEYVAGECVKGLSSVNLQYDIPVAFGVLTHIHTLLPMLQPFGELALGAHVLMQGLVLALFIALVTGAIPAFRVMKINMVDALRV